MHACMHACIHFYSCVVVVVCCYYEMMIRCKINWNISLIPGRALIPYPHIYCWYHSSTFGYIHRGKRVNEIDEKLWLEAHMHTQASTKKKNPNAYNEWCCTIPFFACACMDAFKLFPSLSRDTTISLSLSLFHSRLLSDDINSCHLVNETLAIAGKWCIFAAVSSTAHRKRQAPI